MRYVLVIAEDPTAWDSATEGERQAYLDAHTTFELALRERGAKVFGAALQRAETATTLRHDAGGWTVTDGPFAELVEQLSGFYVVDLPDLDTVIELARLLPPAYTLEIRPEMDIEGWEPP